jgi:nucleoside-diphosphate-sugar epimerase
VRVFVAGASGVIGVHLLPLLVSAGHQVAGMTRSPDKKTLISGLGAEPVVGDVFDVAALTDAVVEFGPDLVMHQLTDLPDDARLISRHLSANARIRREGTTNLLAAARAAGSRGFVAQSVAWELPGEGGEAKAFMEQAVIDAGGVVIRYGQFYGPGTYFPDRPPPPPRIAIDLAARETVRLLDAEPGVIEVVDPIES